MTVMAVAPASVGVKVGDFFVSSWGYDQTNIDFYKVVGLTPKGVKVQKWTSAIVDSTGSQDAVVPGSSPVTSMDYSSAPEGADYWDRQKYAVEVQAPVKTKRLQSYGSGCYIPLNSYSSAYQWDGKPETKTASGWGH